MSSTLPPVTEPNIDVDSEDILLEYFNKEEDMVNTLKKNSGKKFQINYAEHVKMNKKYHVFSMQINIHDEESMKRTTDIISKFMKLLKIFRGNNMIIIEVISMKS